MNNSISLRKRLGLELFRQKEQLIRQKHELHTLFWECTLRCNLACRHCGSDCKAISGQPDMPKEDFLKALDNITPQVDPHRVFIIFTGGEPLMQRSVRVWPGMLSPGIPLGIGNQRFVIIPSEAGQTFTSRPAQHYRKSGRTGRCPQLVTPTSGKLSPGQSGYRNAEPGKRNRMGCRQLYQSTKHRYSPRFQRIFDRTRSRTMAYLYHLSRRQSSTST